MRPTPDYDLGRAHGKVVITADTRDATRGMGEYEQATRRASTAAQDQARIESELTRRRHEAEQALRRRKEAEVEYTRVTKNSKSSVEDQIRVELRRDQARDHSERATRRFVEAERAMQAAIRGNHGEVQKFIRTLDGFGDSVDRHGRKLRDFRSEITKTGLAFKEVGDSLKGTIGILSQAIGWMGVIGGAGGLIGILGGGGITGLLAAAEAVKDFSGALLLLPAAAGGLAVIIGTLAVAFHGVSDALGAMDDPQKFTEALRKLAPAAAQAVRIIASFRDAMKGAMQQVQQSLFQPIVDQIEPLIRTWLPALMRAGQAVAGVFGQAGRVIAQWLQQPQAMQAFTTFITNLVNGLNGILPAITPVLNAFTRLAVIGSTFFPQIAEVITRIANAFNNWVQGASASGGLQSWIQTAITSFEQLMTSAQNVFVAVDNIMSAFSASGAHGAMQWLVDITQEFRNWTEQAQNAQVMTQFFQTMAEAGKVLGPVMRIIGEAFFQLATNLGQLGISMGPQVIQFFTILKEALNVLGQDLVRAGPAIGDAFVALANALLQVVQNIGPSLPSLFESLAKAFVNATPAVAALASALAALLSHITPKEIDVILGIAAAFYGLSLVTPIITAIGAALVFLAENPVVLLVAAVAAAAALIITHWDTVKAAVQGIWDHLKEFASWIGNMFVNAWNSLSSSIKNILDNISSSFTGLFGQAVTWGSTIVSNLVRGMEDEIPGLRSVVDAITSILPDSWKQSRAKRGPLAQMSTEEIGQQMVSHLASGISSGQSDVASAASDVAGGASTGFGGGGTTGTPFTSAGAAGRSGKGVSGFDQWINSIVQDLTSWSSLAQSAFNLFTDVANVVVNTTKVVASLWNRGDNPLTRVGGIAGPQQVTPQQFVWGVPPAEIPGEAPIAALRPGAGAPAGAPPVPQQTVAGVPSAPSPGAPPAAPPPAAPGPGSTGLPPVEGVAGTGPFAAQPPAAAAPTPAAPGAPAAQAPAPGDTPLVAALKAQGSFSPAQIRLIQGFSAVEGLNPSGAPTLGFVDKEIGSTTLQGHVDRLAKQFKDRASVAGPFPEGGTDQEQAQWMARLVGQSGVVDYHGEQQPPDYVNKVVAAMPPRGAAPTPAQAGTTPPLPAGTPPPESAMEGVNLSTIPVAVQKYAGDCIDASARIILSHSGVNMTEDQVSNVIAQGTNIDVQAAGLNKLLPQGKFVAMQGSGGSQQAMFNAIKASIDKGVGSILNVAPGSSLAGHTFAPGHFIAVTGYNPDGTINVSDTANGKVYSVSPADAFQATQGRGIVAGTGTGPPPIGAAPPPAAPPPAAPASTVGAVQPGVPSGPGGITRGGLHIPSGAAPYVAGGVGVLGTAAVVAKAQRFFSNLKWNSKLADFQLEMFRNGGNTDAAIDKVMGIPPDVKAAAPDLYGALRDNIGSALLRTPPEPGVVVAGGGPEQFPGVSPEHNARLAELNALSKSRLADMVAKGANPDMNPLSGLTEGEAREAAKIIQTYPPETFTKPPAGTPLAGPGYAWRTGGPPTGIPPARPPVSVTGTDAPSVVGDASRSIGSRVAGVLGTTGRILALSGPGMSSDVQTLNAQGVPVDSQGRPLGTPGHQAVEELKGYGRALASGATLTGQEPAVTPGVVYGLNGQVISAGPRAPTAPSIFGGPGAQADRRGATPVHVTNPQDLPGGTQSPPVKTTAVERAPRPGEPGFIGPVAPGNVAADQGPQPGAQALRHGQVPPVPVVGAGVVAAPLATQPGVGAPGQAAAPLPFGAKTPLEAFQGGLAAASSIAGDAFQIFNDVITNIKAGAENLDTLVRGFANTEDINRFIDNVQTFIKTGADIAKLVGDVGGLVGGASGGMDFGAGAAIQAIAGVVQGALEATNAAIDLGQMAWQQWSKYAIGIFAGHMLGGPDTGPLAGNVRMLLNTNTGQVYAYSEDNPQNKAIHNMPNWMARSYGGPNPNAQPNVQQNQLNLYVGPGPDASNLISDTMWLVNSGAASTSVAGLE